MSDAIALSTPVPTSTSPSAPAARKREPLVANGVLGMLIFVACEIMFFAGLVSAYLILKAATPPIAWPPPDQPRLPVEATAVNTVVLLLSGALLFAGAKAFRAKKEQALPLLLVATALGAFFVVFQGVEWVRLIGQGLTMRSSAHGAFFYLIVGAHALHVVGALFGLLFVLRALWKKRLTSSAMGAMQVFWTFVVLLWPVLYALVYLS